MAASPLSFTNKSSKIFASRSAAGISVCGWWWWCCCCWVSFLSFSSNLSFSAASETVPTTRTTTTSPTPPPPSHLRASSGGGGGIYAHWRLIIALTVSALFLTLVFLMAFFKFLRFNIRRRSKRVEDVEESGLPKTHSPDRPDIGDFLSKKDNNPQYLAKRFSWEEIEKLAMNFSSVIGEGGFSTVYLAYFSDSTHGALKIHTTSERLNRLFKQELEILLHVRHDNIVKLLGYCDERDEGALVFEYIPNGSLHEKLHHVNGGEFVLPWKNRMSIALQLALAIEYLHEKCTLQIVHGDIKASNVLLDENLNCKLCDFGFAKMGFSSMVMPSSMLMGSPGYMDPHYLRSGIASKKNDVYSFGVLLVELITGIEAFCSEKEQLLTSIAAPILRDANKLLEMGMVDPRLAGDFDAKQAVAMASISAKCLHRQPSLRPSMSDVLRTMRENNISPSPSPSFVARHQHHLLV